MFSSTNTGIIFVKPFHSSHFVNSLKWQVHVRTSQYFTLQSSFRSCFSFWIYRRAEFSLVCSFYVWPIRCQFYSEIFSKTVHLVISLSKSDLLKMSLFWKDENRYSIRSYKNELFPRFTATGREK